MRESNRMHATNKGTPNKKMFHSQIAKADERCFVSRCGDKQRSDSKPCTYEKTGFLITHISFFIRYDSRRFNLRVCPSWIWQGSQKPQRQLRKTPNQIWMDFRNHHKWTCTGFLHHHRNIRRVNLTQSLVSCIQECHPQSHSIVLHWLRKRHSPGSGTPEEDRSQNNHCWRGKSLSRSGRRTPDQN